MANTELHNCLEELLKDENGNAIEPTCGLEKFLSLVCSSISSGNAEAITTDEIDEIMSQ